MDVITTHVNADFDSLGAMVAAKKLYPEAVLVFPGSQERSLRQFFVQSSFFALDVRRAKQVDLDEVRRLILVDVAQADRIGPFAEIVGRPEVEVHVFDHHPESPDDVPARVRHVARVGAATTVLVEMLEARRVPLEPDEATLMILGIYEDTGGLTFSSTTPRDLAAAAYLLGQGAELTAVKEVLTPELTVEQISLLNTLLHNQVVQVVHGVPVTLSEASRDQYVGDLAVLAHKIRDMENLDALILTVRMEDRVHLVARSRVPEVDVAALARAMGGGGHPEAASATVRDLTLIQVREKVLALLPEVVRARITARDVWTQPVKSVTVDTPLREVNELLLRYHINAMPVLRDGVVVGLVTRLLVGRALQHGLEGVPVEEYMVTEFASVAPDAPLDAMRELILSQNQRFLPVLENGVLLGVVTRTDLLRASGGPERSETIPLPRDVQERQVGRLLEERFDTALRERLAEIGREAARLGMQAYLVGGIVRDLVLRRDNQDVDVVVEGDAIALAEALAKAWGCRVRAHRTFGTAQVTCPAGIRVDFATARTEHYQRPAALPAVEWSSIKLDLYRRDFTVNTLALRLEPARFGQIIDFFGGLRDLKEGVIRILHNLSFVDDPTRVLRALRFQLRLGFRLGRQTEKLLRSAVRMGFLGQARGRRLFQEWVLLLDAGDPLEALEVLEQQGVLVAFHPALALRPKVREALARVSGVLTWFQLLYLDTPVATWKVYLLSLLDPLGDEEVQEWARAFGIAQQEGRELLEARLRGYRALAELRALLSGGGGPADSRVHAVLRECTPETLLFLMAKTRDQDKSRLISRYVTRLAGVRTLLRGRDLQELGIPPGKVYRDLLDGLLRARLDGLVETRADEVAWVDQRWREGG